MTSPSNWPQPRTASPNPPPGCPAHVQSWLLADDRLQERGEELFLTMMDRYGPVAPVLPRGDVTAWLVLGYQANRKVLRNHAVFSRDAQLWRARNQGLIPVSWEYNPHTAWREKALFVQIMVEQVRRRRAQPANDLGTFLIADEATLADSEVAEQLWLLLNAGFACTSNLIANVGAVLLTSRRMRNDLIIVRLASANIDGKSFNDEGYLAFGSMHRCPAPGLGCEIANAAVARLFTRLPDLALLHPDEPLDHNPSLIVRALRSLLRTFNPAAPRSSRHMPTTTAMGDM
ncbi:hypothetical protein ABZ864_40660 [Streptomyces sp. NPDC047082]|uniref:hypothetical protein n=1 Tax=Streptomyces sp. NPDC047082 TaxID=3155259 RepID=UPI0033F943FE